MESLQRQPSVSLQVQQQTEEFAEFGHCNIHGQAISLCKSYLTMTFENFEMIDYLSRLHHTLEGSLFPMCL